MRFITIPRVIAGLATAGMLAVSGTSYAAGTAAFSFSPADASEVQGTTFAVAVYENGSNVNVVTANFSYDSSKLEFTGANCAGAFSSTAASSSSSVSCFVPGGSSAVSGTQEVASLSFKAMTAGSANVTITGSTIGSAGSNIWNGVSASAAYAVTVPVASGGGSTGQTGTGSTNSSSTPASSKSGSNPVSTGGQSSSAGTSSPSNITQPNKSNKRVRISTKKSTAPAHVASHHAGLVTSGIGALVIVAVGLYWFFVRKTPVTAVASTKAKPQTAKISKATASNRRKTPAKRH